MDLTNTVTILSLISILASGMSFCVKVVTRRSPEEALHDFLLEHKHHISPTSPQPQSSAHPIPVPAPPKVAVTAMSSAPHRLVPHPWLLGMSMLGFLLILLGIQLGSQIMNGSTTSFSNSTSDWIVLVGGFLYVVALNASVWIAFREKQWEWFWIIFWSCGFIMPLFSIFDRPKKVVV